MTWFDRARVLATALGDVHRKAVVLRTMSRAHAALDEPQPALHRLAEALQIFESLDDERCVAHTLLAIGRIQTDHGLTAGTAATLERAATIFHRDGDRTDEAACWQTLGDLAAARGDHVLARHRHDHATRLLLSTGDDDSPPAPPVPSQATRAVSRAGSRLG